MGKIQVRHKLRHNGVKRTIEGNEHIVDQLHMAIDEMTKYRAANFVRCSMRATCTGAYSVPKKYMTKVLIDRDVDTISVQTGNGEFTAARCGSICRKTSYLEAVMKKLGLTFEFEKIAKSEKYMLRMETLEMKKCEQVTTGIKDILQRYDEFAKTVEIEGTGDEEMDEYILYITKRALFINTLKDDNRKYLAAYNRAKSIFKESSTTGTFPRTYSYGGVLMYWEEIENISSFNTQLSEYLKAIDRSSGEEESINELFEAELLEYNRIHNDHFKVLFLIDKYDYFDDDGE